MSFTCRSATTLILGAGLLLPTQAPAQAANLDLEARMRPTVTFPKVHGHAEFEQEGGFREFEISIHHAGRLAGRVVVVRVHGTLVGRMRVHADGFAHLDRHLGVPSMSAGDVVRVRTKAGKLVSRGVLRVDPD
jgi:hypothetical protein